MLTNIGFKWLFGSLSVGLSVYFTLCLALYLLQKRLIFVPSRQISHTPDTVELDYEDVWIPVTNVDQTTERLHGWWIEGEKGKQEVILYFHGNGDNISANLGLVKRFHQLGFSVLIMDYRGYGLSDGDFPEEITLYQDSQAAWDYLTTQKAIKPENIFLFGHSLGGAIAMDLAVRKPKAAGLILESSFTSMQKMVESRRLYSIFPIFLILNQRFDSLAKLRLLRIPLMVIHGTYDRSIPVSMSQTLFEQADVPKKLYLVPLAGHNNVSSVGGQDYKREIMDFRNLARQQQRQLTQKRL